MNRHWTLLAIALLATSSGAALAQKSVAEEAAAPAPVDRWFLMQSLQGTWLGERLESSGTTVYGWVQQGFAGNIDSPRDRINFGANLGWRANDYRLNQVYV